VLSEKTDSAHKRITENDRITDGIYKIASNVETLALQVKHLTEKLDNSVSSIENSLKNQGERIGALEKEPASKWKNFMWLIIAGITTSVVAYCMTKFF
jgi:uncharacterized protein YlxW (UPF0749 family)